MYVNLNAELRKKNIAQTAVAASIGVTERTFTNKINGTSSFTVDEALFIKRNFLPEYNMDYLFMVEDQPREDGQ